MSNENSPISLKSKEQTVKSYIGLRLQDVVLNSDSSDSSLIQLRQLTLEYRQLHPEVSDRNTLLETVCQTLFHSDLSEVQAMAHNLLRPYRSNGKKRSTLIISSASSSSASQEMECQILQSRGHIIDIPGAIEGRDALSTPPGDTVVISTAAGLEMTRSRTDIQLINLAQEAVTSTLQGSDIYYKADSLLLLILTRPQSTIISQILHELSKNPVVYPYNLDEETQITLCWLAKKANISRIDINANSPEVAVELTRKGYKYPAVEAALSLSYLSDPFEMQTSEWQLSQSASEIGYHPDCVPGYVVEKDSDPAVFYQKTLCAFMLLSTRYDFDSAWVKPDRGTDGGNQSSVSLEMSDITLRSGITELITSGKISEALDLYKKSLTSISEVEKTIDHMWTGREDWLAEAKTHFFEINFPYNGNSRKILTTPSVHIIRGESRYTISLQIVDGVAWGGNLICSPDTWRQLVGLIDRCDPRLVENPELSGQLVNCFSVMTETMQNYVSAINSSTKYKNGQVRGGADLAIATLGGKFGNRLVIAVQDYNARANGCETAYALYDRAQILYSGHGEAVTRNISPSVDFNQLSAQITQAVNGLNTDYHRQLSPNQVQILAVSAGWGQIGIIGHDALANLQNVLLLELQLRKMKLII